MSFSLNASRGTAKTRLKRATAFVFYRVMNALGGASRRNFVAYGTLEPQIAVLMSPVP
jgi:hypothetical protein